MFIVARVPDQIWELKTGQRVATDTGVGGLVGIVATALMWLALPVLWLSLC
jgi:hypothetical protein